jgi:hypothetical protein
MSHRTGKVEIVGVDDACIYMRYHRSHRKEDFGRMLVARRDDEAYWLDQLEILTGPDSLQPKQAAANKWVAN